MCWDESSEPPKHIKVPRSQITPEFIAKIRHLRALNRQRQACVPDTKHEFIRRRLLELPTAQNSSKGDNACTSQEKAGRGKGPMGYRDVKLMTYNMLAQTLIRRGVFPGAKDAVKWSNRSVVIVNEIKYYDCDVLCLQEVDASKWDSFWVPHLRELGYEGRLYKGFTRKVHGVAIFWKRDIFECVDYLEVNLDEEVARSDDNGIEIEARTGTKSVCLLTALKFKDIGDNQRQGLIVGTTHLFWHLFGSFDRTRQLFIILKKFKEFTRMVDPGSDGVESKWLTFLTGDFNSEPCDPPYESIVYKPVHFKGDKRALLACSLAYRYSIRRNSILIREYEEREGHANVWNPLRARNKEEDDIENVLSDESVIDNDDDDDDAAVSATERSPSRESGVGSRTAENLRNGRMQNRSRKGREKEVEEIYPNQPTNPHPETFEETPEQTKLIDNMIALHNSINLRAVSLYSLGYRKVHPANVVLDNGYHGEPEISHIAIGWSGLLDYMFLITGWDGTQVPEVGDQTLSEVEAANRFQLLGLLRMPRRDEMPKHTQPHQGEYASDHLSMVASLRIEL